MRQGNPIVDLKDRTADNVLAALRVNPVIGMWEFENNLWLQAILGALERSGRIKFGDEPYPNYRWEVL